MRALYFYQTLHLLEQNLVDVDSLISACYTLDEGLLAFERTIMSGVLKVLLDCGGG